MQKNDDQEWLDLLSEEIANKDKSDLDKSTKSLRRAIKDYDDMVNVSSELLAQELDKLKLRLRREELAQADGLNKTMSQMANEGLFAGSSDISMSKRIIRFVKKIRLLGIFIVGIVAGLMVPMQMATRGASEPIVSKILGDFNNRDHITSEISLIDVNPLTLSENIIFTCISSKVEVKVLSNKDIQMVIYNLKKSDDQQNILKILLGLTSEAEGNIKVTILKQ